MHVRSEFDALFDASLWTQRRGRGGDEGWDEGQDEGWDEGPVGKASEMPTGWRGVMGLLVLVAMVGGGDPIEEEHQRQTPMRSCRHGRGKEEGHVVTWRKEEGEGAQVLVVEPVHGEVVPSVLYITWEVLYFDMADGFVEVASFASPWTVVDMSPGRDRWRSGGHAAPNGPRDRRASPS